MATLTARIFADPTGDTAVARVMFTRRALFKGLRVCAPGPVCPAPEPGRTECPRCGRSA